MKSVCCAGIVVADTFCGPLDALPDEGQLVAVDAMPTKIGGCAANVAIDLARQGVAVDIVGCVGNDAPARAIIDRLTAAGVDCAAMATTDAEPTSQTVIVLVKGQDRRYIHMFGANRCFTIQQIDVNRLASCGVFYLGGLCAMPGVDFDELADLLRACRKRGIVTVVDVVIAGECDDADKVLALLEHVDYFVPNDDEAARLTGEADPHWQLRTLLEAGAKTAVVTCGEHGALAGRGRDVWRMPVFDMPIVDPSGTGDAFCAGLIAAICRDMDLPDTLRAAAALGASAATAVGTTDGVFDMQQLNAFLASHSSVAEVLKK
jgi:sugar/nucleoside kinase (ribokinase family)